MVIYELILKIWGWRIHTTEVGIWHNLSTW